MAPTDQARPASTDKLWTPANIVTLARICLSLIHISRPADGFELPPFDILATSTSAKKDKATDAELTETCLLYTSRCV